VLGPLLSRIRRRSAGWRHCDETAGEEEVRAAALQFVRKVSGYRKPSRANEEAFESAVDEISAASQRLLESLQRK